MPGPWSTIARRLADESDVLILSFGDLVRSEARRLGLGEDRATLQDLGQKLFATHGPMIMSKMLLQDRTADLIVEGIRHTEILDALLEVLPDLVFVYMTAPAPTLDQRWSARETTDRREDAGRHPVEAQQDLLRDRATLVIDTSQVDPLDAAHTILVAATEGAAGH